MSSNSPIDRSSWAGLALLVLATSPVAAQDTDFPALPLPPAIDGLVGLPQTYTKGRSAHLALVARKAEEEGLPPAVADAVAQVESAYNPNSLGGVGEVGLMQIRPETAAMLGYKGDKSGLFEPETNVQYGVAYLARAWRLANGDLCRALMKYRAGHGEERMTPLSVEYCRRARTHLAAIGSPLAEGALPPAAGAILTAASPQARPSDSAATSSPVRASPVALAREPKTKTKTKTAEVRLPAALRQAGPRLASKTVSSPVRASPVALAAKPATKTGLGPFKAAATRVAKVAPPAPSPKLDRVRVASTSQEAVRTQAMLLLKARQEQRRKVWAEHDARLLAIAAKLKRSRLNIASGI